jgi:hypothetical protein
MGSMGISDLRAHMELCNRDASSLYHVPAVLGVLLAIDHQEHFNRESVAR